MFTSKWAKKKSDHLRGMKKINFYKTKIIPEPPLTCRGGNWPGIFLMGDGELCWLDFPKCNLYWFGFVGVNHLYSNYSPHPQC